MKKPLNPFITTAYAGREWFCDRKDETNTLLNNLQNGHSVTLTSIRRMGKTGLIKHVLAQLPPNNVGVYFDILAAENLNDFFNLFVSALVKAVPLKQRPRDRVWKYIQSLRPTITFDPFTGSPQVNFELKYQEVAPQINALLQVLEQQAVPIVIAIDEFQQILSFPEKNTDAWLRTVIQGLNHIRFIFSGSHQHLMNELFNSPSRPFYRSTQFLKISKIDRTEYQNFILYHFSQNHRIMPEVLAGQILDWTQLHTYYVQLLCNRVYSTGERHITQELLQAVIQTLLKEQENVFFNYRDLLTTTQWFLLKAIATENIVYAPTSGDFLTKYKLGTSATVLQSLTALRKKEMVYREYDSEGNAFYSVYDLLFQQWIQHS